MFFFSIFLFFGKVCKEISFWKDIFSFRRTEARLSEIKIFICEELFQTLNSLWNKVQKHIYEMKAPLGFSKVFYYFEHILCAYETAFVILWQFNDSNENKEPPIN